MPLSLKTLNALAAAAAEAGALSALLAPRISQNGFFLVCLCCVCAWCKCFVLNSHRRQGTFSWPKSDRWRHARTNCWESCERTRVDSSLIINANISPAHVLPQHFRPRKIFERHLNIKRGRMASESRFQGMDVVLSFDARMRPHRKHIRGKFSKICRLAEWHDTNQQEVVVHTQ